MNETNKLASQTPARGVDEFIDATHVTPRYLNYAGYPDADDRTQFRDHWRAIRKRLWLIIGLTAVVTAMAAVYMARKPDIYEAQAQVQVDLENNPSFSGGGGKSGTVMLGGGSDPAYFNTQLRIVNSSRLLGRVVKTLDLENNPDFLRPGMQGSSTWQNLRKLVFSNPKTANQNKNRPASEKVQPNAILDASLPAASLEVSEQLAPYVEALKGSLAVEPVKETRLPSKETRLIELRFTHPNPELAAKITNTIVDTFATANLERRTETNISAGDFLHKRVAELQSQIRSGEEQLNNYAKNNQILSLDASQNIVVERLNGLNRQLLEAENQRKLAEAAYQSKDIPGAAEALADSGGSATRDAENRLAQLQQEREELLSENTEESPLVVAIDRQIAVLEKQITNTRKHAVATIVTNLETRYREALNRERALREAFDQQRSQTLAQNEAAINYRIIQQEIDTHKGLLNGLLQRSKENDVMLASLAGTANNIHVVDYALVPKRPIGPRRWLTIGLAFFFALIFSVALAIFFGHLDDSLKSSEDVERMLRLPALAVVPAIGGLTGRRLLSGRTLRRLLPGGSRWKSGNGNGKHEAPPLVTGDTQSPLAEAYRRLRTSVLLSTAGHPPKTLLVTSSLPDEGKSTTAVNMALTLASSGEKVLIIDADLHRPSLNNIFNIDKRDGLSTALVQELEQAELLNLITEYKDTNLSVLLSGPIPPNPAELLGSKQMRNLMTTLEAAFTYIIIDSPPITYFTDGVLLTSLVDGVVLVVNSGKTSRFIVRRSQKVLHDVNARLFGVVLNNADLKPLDYSY